MDPGCVRVAEVLVDHERGSRNERGIELRDDPLRQRPRLHGIDQQHLDRAGVPHLLMQIPGVQLDPVAPARHHPLELPLERVTLLVGPERRQARIVVHPRLPQELVIRVDVAASGGRVAILDQAAGEARGGGAEPRPQVHDFSDPLEHQLATVPGEIGALGDRGHARKGAERQGLPRNRGSVEVW